MRMSKFVAAVTTAVMTLAPAPLLARTHVDQDTWAEPQEIHRVKDSSGKEVEVLTGKEALSHLKNLKAKSPKAFDKSIKHLTERGFTPTETVMVIRSVAGEIVPVQTSVETSEGEIVFWSWTDGDSSTWEGSMYATKYATGQETVHEGQIDTQSHYVLWEYMSYDSPRQRYQTTDRGASNGGLYLLTSNRPYDNAIQTVATAKPKIRSWVGCVVGGCLSLGLGCALSGPLYPECVVLGCAGTKIGCTAQWIIENWP